jgi:hypothetical protein
LSGFQDSAPPGRAPETVVLWLNGAWDKSGVLRSRQHHQSSKCCVVPPKFRSHTRFRLEQPAIGAMLTIDPSMHDPFHPQSERYVRAGLVTDGHQVPAQVHLFGLAAPSRVTCQKLSRPLRETRGTSLPCSPAPFVINMKQTASSISNRLVSVHANAQIFLPRHRSQAPVLMRVPCSVSNPCPCAGGRPTLSVQTTFQKYGPSRRTAFSGLALQRSQEKFSPVL